MKAYHIYLLRHGMTEGNEQGRYVGRLDVPLSARGRQELQAMREKGGYPQTDVLFSSPLQRCVESLKILYPDAEPITLPGLAECSFGDYEGKTLEELKDDPRYRAWASGMAEGNASVAPPGGESSADFQKRVCLAFGQIVERLTRSGVTHAVVMAHGGVIMTILGVFGLPRRPFYEWMAGNGTGYEVIVTPQLWMNGRVVEVAAEVPYAREEHNMGAVDTLLDDIKQQNDEE